MGQEIQTKAELAKSGSSCILGFILLAGVVMYFIYPPLSLLAGVAFVYWRIKSSREIRRFKKSGEVYLGDRVELIDLKKTVPDSIPFAVVIDVETTGLLFDDSTPTLKKVQDNPGWYPRIVQIAWITLNRNYEIVSKESHYIKQSEEIPLSAINIHGITNEICNEKGEELTDVLKQFSEAMSSCDYFVGHNVMFDKHVIEAECLKKQISKPFKNMKKYDTMMMGRSIIGRNKFKLEELAQKVFGSEFRNGGTIEFHNADSDVWITASIFAVLHKNNLKY